LPSEKNGHPRGCPKLEEKQESVRRGILSALTCISASGMPILFNVDSKRIVRRKIYHMEK
jgi:hypothetical protein